MQCNQQQTVYYNASTLNPVRPAAAAVDSNSSLIIHQTNNLPMSQRLKDKQNSCGKPVFIGNMISSYDQNVRPNTQYTAVACVASKPIATTGIQNTKDRWDPKKVFIYNPKHSGSAPFDNSLRYDSTNDRKANMPFPASVNHGYSDVAIRSLPNTTIAAIAYSHDPFKTQLNFNQKYTNLSSIPMHIVKPIHNNQRVTDPSKLCTNFAITAINSNAKSSHDQNLTRHRFAVRSPAVSAPSSENCPSFRRILPKLETCDNLHSYHVNTDQTDLTVNTKNTPADVYCVKARDATVVRNRTKSRKDSPSIAAVKGNLKRSKPISSNNEKIDRTLMSYQVFDDKLKTNRKNDTDLFDDAVPHFDSITNMSLPKTSTRNSTSYSRVAAAGLAAASVFTSDYQKVAAVKGTLKNLQFPQPGVTIRSSNAIKTHTQHESTGDCPRTLLCTKSVLSPYGGKISDANHHSPNLSYVPKSEFSSKFSTKHVTDICTKGPSNSSNTDGYIHDNKNMCDPNVFDKILLGSSSLLETTRCHDIGLIGKSAGFENVGVDTSTCQPQVVSDRETAKGACTSSHQTFRYKYSGPNGNTMSSLKQVFEEVLNSHADEVEPSLTYLDYSKLSVRNSKRLPKNKLGDNGDDIPSSILDVEATNTEPYCMERQDVTTHPVTGNRNVLKLVGQISTCNSKISGKYKDGLITVVGRKVYARVQAPPDIDKSIAKKFHLKECSVFLNNVGYLMKNRDYAQLRGPKFRRYLRRMYPDVLRNLSAKVFLSSLASLVRKKRFRSASTKKNVSPDHITQASRCDGISYGSRVNRNEGNGEFDCASKALTQDSENPKLKRRRSKLCKAVARLNTDLVVADAEARHMQLQETNILRNIPKVNYAEVYPSGKDLALGDQLKTAVGLVRDTSGEEVTISSRTSPLASTSSTDCTGVLKDKGLNRNSFSCIELEDTATPEMMTDVSGVKTTESDVDFRVDNHKHPKRRKRIDAHRLSNAENLSPKTPSSPARRSVKHYQSGLISDQTRNETFHRESLGEAEIVSDFEEDDNLNESALMKSDSEPCGDEVLKYDVAPSTCKTKQLSPLVSHEDTNDNGHFSEFSGSENDKLNTPDKMLDLGDEPLNRSLTHPFHHIRPVFDRIQSPNEERIFRLKQRLEMQKLNLERLSKKKF